MVLLGDLTDVKETNLIFPIDGSIKIPKVTLNFAVGSLSSCNLLVGTDGIKLAVRASGCMMRDIARTLSERAAGSALSASSYLAISR